MRRTEVIWIVAPVWTSGPWAETVVTYFFYLKCRSVFIIYLFIFTNLVSFIFPALKEIWSPSSNIVDVSCGLDLTPQLPSVIPVLEIQGTTDCPNRLTKLTAFDCSEHHENWGSGSVRPVCQCFSLGVLARQTALGAGLRDFGISCSTWTSAQTEEDIMGCCSGRCTLAFICGMQLVSAKITIDPANDDDRSW